MSEIPNPQDCPEQTYCVEGRYYVYILQCSDGSYYIGYTENIEQRLLSHRKGRGARYTALRLPIVLVHSESYSSQSKARTREIQLKKWSHSKKLALIQTDLEALRVLSKSRE
jgi:putative endonuclease